jgi:Tfp pilus assembly PilM family ATPase
MIGKLAKNHGLNMRVQPLRWLLGVPHAIVGAWWGGDAICLARIGRDPQGNLQVECAYEVLSGELTADEGSQDQDQAHANTLRSLLERWGGSIRRLALGIPVGDVFIKKIEVPVGLEDRDLMKLAIVEAVSNLPVPPEEVCADYLRVGLASKSGQEQIRIAFCRRELIDELTLVAEDAGVQLAIIDRNVQALHDAARWLMTRHAPEVQIEYPLILLWTTDSPVLLIARDELDLIQYSLQTADLLEQIQASCRRSGISDDAGPYDLWVFETSNADENLGHLLSMRPGPVYFLKPEKLLPIISMSPLMPLVPMMCALGMALRETT